MYSGKPLLLKSDRLQTLSHVYQGEGFVFDIVFFVNYIDS